MKLLVINIIISAGIILSTTLIGYICALNYDQRIKLLNTMLFSIKIMETDMCYSQNYLVDILIKLSMTKERAISDFYVGIYTDIYKNLGMDLEAIWIKNVDELLSNSPFTKEDLKIIKELGKSLGKIDFINQEKIFKYIGKRIELQLKEAEEQRDKKSRVYKNLGVAAGVMIVVILI